MMAAYEKLEDPGGPGCASHADDRCLCDVTVLAPAQIRYTPDQVWHGDIIARALGIDFHDIDSAKLAEYLEALGGAYDVWVEQSDPDRHEHQPYTRELGQKIKQAITDGASIIDVPEVVGCTWHHVMQAMTANRPGSKLWRWTQLDWIKFEGMILDGKNFHQEIAPEVGLHPKAAYNLGEPWRKQAGYKPWKGGHPQKGGNCSP